MHALTSPERGVGASQALRRRPPPPRRAAATPHPTAESDLRPRTAGAGSGVCQGHRQRKLHERHRPTGRAAAGATSPRL